MDNRRLDRAELLMAMCKDARADNDDWRRQMWREGNERAKRIVELLTLLDQEYTAMEHESKQLAHYLPRPTEQQQPMPKVVGKGPAT
jgi:hypothetical protein